jgi:hypothetical protein
MARGEVWNETKDLFVAGSHHIAQVRFFVAQDDAAPLDRAFEMLVSLRFLGAQIDNDPSRHFPVRNGPVAVNVSVAGPTTVVKGLVAEWRGIEGKVVDGSVVAGHGNTLAPGADWSKVNAVGFTLSGQGTIALPVDGILRAIPTLSLAALLLGKSIPAEIPLEIGHPPILIPIHRDARGHAVLPPHSVTPDWWT